MLEYNEDPSYMANLALYELTLEARRRFDQSGLSAREVARWLGTSPAQLYRLLDPANYSKSVKKLILLLYVLGFQVEFAVRKRSDTNQKHRARTPTRRRRTAVSA